MGGTLEQGHVMSNWALYLLTSMPTLRSSYINLALNSLPVHLYMHSCIYMHTCWLELPFTAGFSLLIYLYPVPAVTKTLPIFEICGAILHDLHLKLAIFPSGFLVLLAAMWKPRVGDA